MHRFTQWDGRMRKKRRPFFLRREEQDVTLDSQRLDYFSSVFRAM
jgi:hypothetical protein